MSEPLPNAGLHAGFLELVPRLQRQAAVWFKHVRCPGRHADLVAETTALAWLWYLRLTQRGKDPHAFEATFIHRALQAVRCHRRLCGQTSGKDALSPVAQTRQGFAAQTLPEHDTGGADNLLVDALADNSATPPDEQAAFRIDFPAWLETLTPRNRSVVVDLLLGDRTGEAAQKHGLTAGRISQLRAELHAGWLAFCGSV